MFHLVIECSKKSSVHGVCHGLDQMSFSLIELGRTSCECDRVEFLSLELNGTYLLGFPFFSFYMCILVV